MCRLRRYAFSFFYSLTLQFEGVFANIFCVLQPTGGVILVNDTTPSEPKTLVERQIKKAVPQPPPQTPGQTTGAPAPASDTDEGNFGTARHATLLALLAASSVDQDLEGEDGENEGAEAPGNFEYESEGEDEGDE